MSMYEYFFFTFRSSLMGHVTLVAYLLVVMQGRTSKKELKRIPLLILSPAMAALIFTCFEVTAPRLQTVPYVTVSLAVLLMCTLWAMWAWRLPCLEIVSPVCMAAILQVAMAALSQILFYLLPFGTPLQYTLIMCIYYPVVLASAILLKKIRFGTYFQLLMENRASLRQTALLLFALEITMEIFFILQWGIDPAYLAVYCLLVIALTALMAGLLVYLARQFDAARRIQAQQDIIAQQQLYEQALEDIRRETRSFRHDYKNLLASLAEQANSGKLEDLRHSLEKLDSGFDHRLGEKIRFSTQIGNLQIPQARSLLLGKLTAMQKNGVECRLEVLYPVRHVNMDVWDFVRCLGILLDNAMEAAAETESPWVEVLLLQQKNSLALRISNPCPPLAAPSKIWEEGWSTKGTGRGLGLSGYRRILAGCPHAIPSTSWRNGVFVQELTVGERL